MYRGQVSSAFGHEGGKPVTNVRVAYALPPARGPLCALYSAEL